VSTNDTTTTTTPCPRYPRLATSQLLEGFRDQQRCGTSARQFAQQQQLPRTTLQAWLARQRRLDLPPEVVQFFDSPVGLTFLHRLVTAAHLIFGLQGSAGLRLLRDFFRRCQLDRFVAASYGSRQQFAAALEQGVIDFATTQRQQLAQDMAPKAIAVAEDETYHPAICLVAIEPVSNFVIVEHYADQRDAATWNAALQQGLQGLPVTVVQSVSDEAKGLLAHAQVGLGVPHSPDVFHVQHEQSRGTAPVLAAQQRQAQRAVEQAQQQYAVLQQAQHEAQQLAAAGIRPPGRPLDHERRVQAAAATLADRQRQLAGCLQRQEQARAAIRQVGAADHPFDLASGRAQGAPVVAERLTAACAQLEAVAEAAALPEGSCRRLAKARRVVPGLVAAVAFFWLRVRTAAQALGPGTWGWAERLTAGMYLRRVASKQRTAEQRAALRALAEQCLAEARALGVEPPGGWAAAERLAWEWSGWFQRSSSCVEGRNGQLALRHHSLHKLSGRKLAALTALHNYWIKRGGQTAAERFFGQKPADLFEWLMARLPLPARPAQLRQKGA
jgi:hypothetical protein